MVQFPWLTQDSIFVLVNAIGEGIVEYQYLLVPKLKKSFVYKQLGVSNTLEEIKPYIGNVPITLCLSGKGIIIREIESIKDDQSMEQIISKILPNANTTDFDLQVHFDTAAEKYFVAISRRSIVDEILEKFSAHNITVGNFILGDLSQLSGSYRVFPEFFSTNHKVIPDNFEKDQFKSIFSLAYDESIDRFRSSVPASSILAIQKKEFKYFNLTKRVIVVFPIIMLLLLIANFFLYRHFEAEYINSTAAIETKKGELDSIAMIENILSQRSEFLGSGGGIQSIPASYYSDRIGQTIPPEITLKIMDIYPISINQETHEIQKIKFDTISVAGQTLSSSVLNTWVRRINQMDWIESVSIVNFQQSNANDVGEFELVLALR